MGAVILTNPQRDMTKRGELYYTSIWVFHNKDKLMLEIFSEEIEMALENGWPLKLVRAHGSFVHNAGIDDPSTLVTSMKDITPDASAVAVMGNMIDDFICVDIDTKDKELHKKIFSIMAKELPNLSNAFFRKGHPDKGGQFWFKCIGDLNNYEEKSVEGVLDIIFKSKRCDAIGQYKDNVQQTYTWPSVKFWEYSPSDMPLISISAIEKILDACMPYGVLKSSSDLKSRHDSKLKKIASFPEVQLLAEKIWKTEEFQSHIDTNYEGSGKWKANRNIPSEDARSLTYAIASRLSELTKVGGPIEINFSKKGELDLFEVERYKSVEKGSLIDIFYRAILRNSFIDNRELAFLTALSAASLICSYGYSFRGLNLNLMLLYIGSTGAGKSTSLKLFEELAALFPKISNGIKTEENGSLQGLVAGISQEPISIIIHDEISDMFKAVKTKQGPLAGAPEILTKLYSNDYTKRPYFRRLAGGIKDPVSGIRLSILGMTNHHVFEYITPELYEQGFMRRFLPMVDTGLKYQKESWQSPEEFFTTSEKLKIKAIMKGLLGSGMLKNKINIEKYHLLKGQDLKGQNVEWKDCWKGVDPIKLSATDETSKFISKDIVRESNKVLKELSIRNDNLRIAAMRSYVENIIKFSAIHSLCGKQCLEESEVNNQTYYSYKLNTVVEKDSVDWARSNIIHWFMTDAMEKINNKLSKEEGMEYLELLKKEFMQYLKEKEVKEFGKSSMEVRTFFSTSKKRKAKIEVLQSLITDEKLRSNNKGDSLHYGVKLIVVDTEIK